MPDSVDHDPLRHLALSTEESAVREQFDAHNTKYGWFLSVGLTIFSVPLMIAYLANPGRGPAKLIGALATFAVSVVLYLLTSGRSRSLRSLAGPNLSVWIAGFLVLLFAGVGTIAHRRPDDMAVIATIAVWILLFFRMPFARRMVVHALLALILVALVESSPGRNEKNRGEYYGPSFSSSVVTLFIGGWLSRRARRTIVRDWSERRTQAAEQLRMRDELALARRVQLSMLPAAPPQLPWLDIAASSTPATEVGGDYYDYFAFGGRMAIVCGDVAGHGFASGFVLAALRSGFTLLRESLGDPARVLIRLHELIEQTSRTRMLTTAVVVSIDPQSRRAKIASAGHPPVMFRSGGSVRAIELFGPPLGVRLPISIAQTEVDVQTGDVFVLHSDGVYETANATGELYGLDRLAAVIAQRSDATAEGLRDAILADVDGFRGDHPQADDVTVVVVQFRA